MDLNGTIRDLRAEIEKIDAVIAELEALNRSDTRLIESRSTRGRKSMGEAERREVSARMKRYWETRRNTKSAS